MTTNEGNGQTSAEIKEEWLALEDTPEWAKPVIEQAAQAEAIPMVHLAAELSFAIRLCAGNGEDRLRRFATDPGSPEWLRESVRVYMAMTSRWQSNRHISDLQTLLALVNALLED